MCIINNNKLKNYTIVDDFITGDNSKESLIRLKIIAARSVKRLVLNSNILSKVVILLILWRFLVKPGPVILSVACKEERNLKETGFRSQQFAWFAVWQGSYMKSCKRYQ